MSNSPLCFYFNDTLLHIFLLYKVEGGLFEKRRSSNSILLLLFQRYIPLYIPLYPFLSEKVEGGLFEKRGSSSISNSILLFALLLFQRHTPPYISLYVRKRWIIRKKRIFVKFSSLPCFYFNDTFLHIFLYNVRKSGRWRIRVVEEGSTLLIAVTLGQRRDTLATIGRDSGMVTGAAEVSFFTAPIAFAIYANAGRLTIVARSRSLSDSFFSLPPSGRNGEKEEDEIGTPEIITAKVEDEWSGPRCLDTLSPRERAKESCTSGRHFRRIVDRVRDDDGDLGEVLLLLLLLLEPRSRTTNNKLVRWAEIDFPHSGIDHYEEDRRCGSIVPLDCS